MKGTYYFMKKSITKEQKIDERLIKKTLESGYCTFNDLYNAFFPKHFWQKRLTSWQKEHDDFFRAFKNNYKIILADAIKKEVFKKQLKKSSLSSDSIFEKRVFISNETIITVYFSCEKNQTIGIFQTIKFCTPMDLDWDNPGLLQPSSSIGCFCIKKSKFKNLS